jgi:SRSO17 transposase
MASVRQVSKWVRNITVTNDRKQNLQWLSIKRNLASVNRNSKICFRDSKSYYFYHLIKDQMMPLEIFVYLLFVFPGSTSILK